MRTTNNCLVADIGGTQTRMALASWEEGRPIRLQDVTVRHTSELGDLAQAMVEFGRRFDVVLDAVAACAAGPVQRGGDVAISLTNLPVQINAADLKGRLKTSVVVLVNDFVAQAAAAPVLGEQDLAWHEGGRALLAPCAVIGPGTGLGAATWLGAANVLQGEGGHRELSPADDREAALFPAIADEYGFVSAEDMLSGPGLLRMYGALCTLDGRQTTVDNPHRVTALACSGGDPQAREALDRFTAALGRVSGDFALCVGARSVLLAGGIVAGLGGHFDSATYRHHFRSKGRFTKYMDAIGSATLLHPYPALLGLMALAKAALDGR